MRLAMNSSGKKVRRVSSRKAFRLSEHSMNAQGPDEGKPVDKDFVDSLYGES